MLCCREVISRANSPMRYSDTPMSFMQNATVSALQYLKTIIVSLYTQMVAKNQSWHARVSPWIDGLVLHCRKKNSNWWRTVDQLRRMAISLNSWHSQRNLTVRLFHERSRTKNMHNRYQDNILSMYFSAYSFLYKTLFFNWCGSFTKKHIEYQLKNFEVSRVSRINGFRKKSLNSGHLYLMTLCDKIILCAYSTDLNALMIMEVEFFKSVY